MAVTTEWNKLREWRGSKDKGFEELLWQIKAGYELPGHILGTKLDGQDGGTEGYWNVPNEGKWGYQAKFVERSTKIFPQLDKSVKTALECYPDLTRYRICVPFNMQGRGEASQVWFQDHWNKNEKKWISWAAELGRSVTFEFFGESHIFALLTKHPHLGRFNFWFGKTMISEEWLRGKAKQTISALLNDNDEDINVVSESEEACLSVLDRAAYKKKFAQSHQNLQRFIRVFERLSVDDGASWHSTLSALLNVENNLQHFLRITPMQSSELKGAVTLAQSTLNSVSLDTLSEDKLNRIQQEKWSALDWLRSIEDDLNSFSMRLFDCRRAVLVGPPGIGKTHLLCKFAEQHIDRGHAALLLSGREFSKHTPLWKQINDQLQGDFENEDDLLSSLQFFAESSGELALILIDALNDSEDPSEWKYFLPKLLSATSNYNHVAVLCSIRKTFESQCIPSQLAALSCARLELNGFEGREELACEQIFEKYGIRLEVSRLGPEYSNPLFVMLLCRGLKKLNLTSLPKGVAGLFQIFDFFVDSVNAKLDQNLDLASGSSLASKALKLFAEEMIDTDSYLIPQSRAIQLAEQIYQGTGWSKSLLALMLQEGILISEPAPTWAAARGTTIHLAFQRFSDYLQSAVLVERGRANGSFDRSKLDAYLNDSRKIYCYSNLIEMLSIYLPEKVGMELFQCVPPAHRTHEVIANSFLSSLIWRQIDPIPEITIAYFNEIAHYFGNEIFDCLINLSERENHYFGADYLHRHLISKKIVFRDKTWSRYVNRAWHEGGALDRFTRRMQFGKNNTPRKHSTALILSWCLSSSDRSIRDKATKLLIELLHDDFTITSQLLDEFLDCDDLYVLERLAAVSFAVCASTKNAKLAMKMRDIFIFGNQSAINNILIALYLESTFEKCNIQLSIDAIPPTPLGQVATKEELSDKHDILNRSEVRGMNLLWYHLCDQGEMSYYHLSKLFSQFDIDTNFILRWIFVQVEKLGWNPVPLDYFEDIRHTPYYHERPVREVLGAKYVWIFAFEALAKLQHEGLRKIMEHDNISLILDIDPTLLLTGAEGVQEPIKLPVYSDFTNATLEAWTKDESDLPNVQQLTELDWNGQTYLVLNGTVNRKSVDDKKSQKEFYLFLNCYLIEQNHMLDVSQWLSEQNFFGRWMPEVPDVRSVFFEAIPFSSAYRKVCTPFFGFDGWTSSFHNSQKQSPPSAFHTVAQEYHWSERDDCSFEDSIEILIPDELLLSGLKLTLDGLTGTALNDSRDVVAFDARTNNRNSDSLLLCRKDLLEEWLCNTNQSLVWTFLGEKLTWKAEYVVNEERLLVNGNASFTPSLGLKGKLRTTLIDHSRDNGGL
jgi:hypothetical protein